MGRLIPIAFLIALFIEGCGPRTQPMDATARSEGVSPDLPLSIGKAEIPYSDLAKAPLEFRLGPNERKAFANGDLTLRRSPRDTSDALYRVTRGSVLNVSRSADPKWLRIGLTKKREAFVRKDQVSDSLALALAQGKVADKARLNPKPKHGNEPDVGDGKGGEPGSRDPELDDAIAELSDAVKAVEDAWDRIKGDLAAFGGASEQWPNAKNGALQDADLLSGSLSELFLAAQGLARISGQLTANERSALQAITVSQSNAQDSLASIRQLLNQMAEGADWSPQISALEGPSGDLGAMVEALRTAVNRL